MPFQPGQSGNPGGRPKEEPRVRDAARQHTEAAIQTLVDGLADPSGKVRISAAQALLDRGWGKAPQSLAIANDGDEPFRIEKIVRELVRPPSRNG